MPPPLGHTTPDQITLHRHSLAMAKAGVTHCAMVAPPIGLDQRRLGAWPPGGAAFTILAGTIWTTTDDGGYFSAKAGLFPRTSSARAR